jgi:O-antigen/teichoic acid export membrane protein
MQPRLATDRPGIIPRLLHGAGAGAVSYGIGVISNLVLLPLYLRSWSVAAYGEWMALYSLVSYFSSLDFGVTAAGINAATMAYARGDWRAFKRAQGASWAASLAIVGAGTALVVVPFLAYFRVERWLGLKVFTPGESRVVFCCLMVSLLANIPGRQLISVYIAIGEFAKYQWLYNAFLLGSCIATAAFLLTGAGPVLLAWVTLAMALLTVAIAAWLLRRRDPRLVPSIRDADWQTARALAAPTAQFGLSILATAITIQGPVVILSRALGGSAVAVFTSTRTIANIIRQALTLIRAPLRPELAAQSATRSKAAMGRVLRFAVSADMVVGLTLFAAFWTSGCWVLEFWSRARIKPDSGFLHLILISVLMEGFFLFIGSMGWSMNRARTLAMAQLATAVASLLLALPLLHRFGISAIPLGAMPVLLLIMAPVGFHDACKHTDFTLKFSLGRILLPFAALGAISAICAQWFAGLKIVPQPLSGCIAAAAACVLATLFSGSLLLTRDDRRGLWVRISGRVGAHAPTEGASV